METEAHIIIVKISLTMEEMSVGIVTFVLLEGRKVSTVFQLKIYI